MVRRSLVTLQFAIMIGLGITTVTIWRQTPVLSRQPLRVDGSSILSLTTLATLPAEPFKTG